MPKSWSTRREARAQPFTQYDETGLQALLDSFEARMAKLNDMYLRLMGEHIADIGTLWPSDVHRLQQIRRMNKNLHDIERRIAEVAGQSREEIETLFQKIAQEDARMAGKILGAPDTVNVKDNLPLQRILRAQARETAGRMTNLSNSTALSGKYRDAVDVAVNAVQSGVEDYGSAIRRVIREAGQSGLRVRENGTRVVDYESGRSVRIDTAARMSVLDGVRHLNQSVMEEVGRQFGADGVEIDAHMLCAEDHVPYQGGQYSNEEFEQIQDSLQRPFGEWNCRHSWHPIMMGISPRTYSDDELSEMRRYSTEQIEIDGRTKTRYQWSQEMRRVETRIRQVKDTATLARYSGDDVLRRQCQQQIGVLNERYKTLAQGAGLKPEYQRTYVAGFRDAKVENVTSRATKHALPMVYTVSDAVKSTETVSFDADPTYHVYSGPADVFTMPDGTRFCFKQNMDPTRQTMQSDMLISSWYKVPDALRALGQREIDVVDTYNPEDAYWRTVYKNFPGSYATGGDKITFYRFDQPHDPDYVVRTLCHEIAHNVDTAVGGSSPFSEQAKWQKAMMDDLIHSGFASITTYGENSPNEDFAESIAEYITNPSYFLQFMPNRGKLIADIIRSGGASS